MLGKILFANLRQLMGSESGWINGGGHRRGEAVGRESKLWRGVTPQADLDIWARTTPGPCAGISEAATGVDLNLGTMIKNVAPKQVDPRARCSKSA